MKDEIETIKQCKRLKEQKKEPNWNLINILDGFFDKDIFLSESKNSNSEEQWLIVKKQMKRLENEK